MQMFAPQYSITNKILTGIASIEAAREVIVNAPLVPYWERQFSEERVVRTVHYSTALEGNPLSIEDVRKVLGGEQDQVKAYQRDIQEVINYRNVVKYIESIPNSAKRIDKGHMFEIHKLTVENVVPEDEKDDYRVLPWGTKSSTTGEVSFVAPEPELVPPMVDDFFAWVDSEEFADTHPILRSGIILAHVALIHPFTEGNGRTARGLATASLYLDGYDIKKFFCLDEYYDQNSEGYYQAIQTYQSEEDNLATWLRWISNSAESRNGS